MPSAAFALFFKKHHAQIVRLAFSFTQDIEEARDVAQDTFLRAYRFRSRLEAGRDPKTWLFVIARRCALDSLRRNNRRTALLAKHNEVPGTAASPEQIVLAHDEALYVRDSIAGLRQPYQSVIRLHYVHGLCYREVAAELRIPLGTAKTLIYRAKQQLKTELEGTLRAYAST